MIDKEYVQEIELELRTLQEIIDENDVIIGELVKENNNLKAHNKVLKKKVEEYAEKLFEQELI